MELSMPVTLKNLVDHHFTVVEQPHGGGRLFWKVKLADPALAARYPWLLEMVLKLASPPADEDADYRALQEASAVKANQPPAAERDAEWLSLLQDLAREVVIGVSDDGTDWRPARLVKSADERADPRHPEDAELPLEKQRPHPTEPLCVEVGFPDRVTLQAIGYSAVSRLEGVVAAAHRFRLLKGGWAGGSDGQDGPSLRNHTS